MGENCDAAAVSDLLKQTWHATYDQIIGRDEVTAITSRWHSESVLMEQIDRQDACFLVADVAGTLAGHAYARQTAADTFELSRLYVLPQMQGRGLGAALLVAVVKQCKGKRMVLEVQEENTRARDFYLAHGFRITGRNAHCGNDSNVPALAMERSVE